MISEISHYTYLIAAALVRYNFPIDIVILRQFTIQGSDVPPIIIPLVKSLHS